MKEEFKKLFENKTILITGGTGFLGKALIYEILKYSPQSIRVFSRDEVKHHHIQELYDYDTRLRNLIGDVRDYRRLERATEGVDIVIHAAALKRIDILEYNVGETIKTNVNGTLNVVEACLANNVEKAIFISTDKACSPVNTYGACKFIGERIFTESNYSKGNKRTIFTFVRYGNVLESTGSVIPFFESKIEKGVDIPLTDKRMTRFIITPEGAVNLVFNALHYAIGGEVFVPKLPSLKIVDLIDILKEKHNAKNKIKVIGLRPGENIHESMINSTEVPRTYEFKDMYVITACIEDNPNIGKIRLENAEYFDKKNILTEEKMENYSSKDALVSKDEVKRIFKRYGLI